MKRPALTIDLEVEESKDGPREMSETVTFQTPTSKLKFVTTPTIKLRNFTTSPLQISEQLPDLNVSATESINKIMESGV